MWSDAVHGIWEKRKEKREKRKGPASEGGRYKGRQRTQTVGVVIRGISQERFLRYPGPQGVYSVAEIPDILCFGKRA